MTGFIIVERDKMFCDCGVVTGTMRLEVSDHFAGTHPMVLGRPEISPHIEHAFIFPGAWQAYRWMDRILKDREAERGLRFLQFDVRADGDYHPGVHWMKGHVQRTGVGAPPEQIAAEWYARGLADGEKRITNPERATA